MLKEAINQMKAALILLIVLTGITGVIYPFIVTTLAQVFFPKQANGSLIHYRGKLIGSSLIGQQFNSPAYFWSRPSATSPFPYNGASSSGSNKGPSNPTFLITIRKRIQALESLADTTCQESSCKHSLIPVDLVTASGSGLDPEISPFAAYYQIPRIAKVRRISKKEVLTLVQKQIKPRVWGIFGEPRINVLQLNLALDHLRTNHGQPTPKS